MDFPSRCSLYGFLALALAAFWQPGPASAQYHVYQWANFEDGLPEGSVTFGKHAAERVRPVDLSTVSGMPPSFRNETAVRETGRQALLMKAAPESTSPADIMHGLGVGIIFERDQLGTSGKAIYQADFFFPANIQRTPAVAVLATEPLLPPPPGLPVMPRDYYRFGVSHRGFYFSCVSKRNPSSGIYKLDSQLLKSLPRPGWHRLAIVFEGSDTIRCYVDGREPSFSPIRHRDLRKLQVGVMLAEDFRFYDTYVDNLSIQVSQGDIDLPESPYSAGWKVAAKSSGTRLPPLTAALTGVQWMEPVAAWGEAQRQGKPLLLYFHASTVPATRQFNQLLETNTSARAFLARHCCAQVDVNQLSGGAIAKQYGVFRVPSFLIITPQATEAGRATFTLDDTWDSFMEKLK